MSSLRKLMPKRYQRMSKALGYCLTLGDSASWLAFSALAFARLSEHERAALAFAALKSLEPDTAEMTAAAAVDHAGMPSTCSYLGDMNEARFWASYATESELKAYVLAAYEAMNYQDQNAFSQHISEVGIAK